ncbi:MAG: cysteine synthase A [Tannerella sp.]|jgi:cysteine synthase A|nr:cysteine synthase A [Tannerella sp.]
MKTGVFASLAELIGDTPMVELSAYAADNRLGARLVAKLEYFNPTGSVKVRTAYALIVDAEQKRLIHPGDILIEATGGNYGIGLAFVCVIKGYKLILTMPETTGSAHRNQLKAMGASLVLTPAAEGMGGAVRKAEELCKTISSSFILRQFENQAGPAYHMKTTAEEIWRDLDGKIDFFVAGVGTGSTVSGVGAGLKLHDLRIQTVAVEPEESAVLSGNKPGAHRIRGIGAGFVPRTYHPDVVDEIIQVNSDDAIRTSRELARREGLLVGISSGAAVFAAVQLAKRPGNEGKTVVVLLPDASDRYSDTALYAFEDYPL